MSPKSPLALTHESPRYLRTRGTRAQRTADGASRTSAQNGTYVCALGFTGQFESEVLSPALTHPPVALFLPRLHATCYSA
jgi:hypothetical protein